MKKNMEYVLKNAQGNGNLVDWLMQIKAFFGEEQAEAFCDHYIHSHQIMRQEDLRNLLPRHTLSVYWAMEQEQLAFLTVYHVIDRKSDFVKNRENGFEKVQKFYRKKDEELARKIRELGYSYVAIETNWKEKEEKNIFQREYIFCIFSEKVPEAEFVENILELAKTIKQEKVIITDGIKDKGPKAKISGKIYEISSKKEVEALSDIVIPTLEKHLENLSGTKVMFQIPYAKNKTILFEEEGKLKSHYSWQKQEKVKQARVDSFNMGMLKQALVSQFQRKDDRT